MISAVFFPLMIGATLFFALAGFGSGNVLGVPVVAASAALTTAFGWRYVHGLRRARAAVPPIPHRARRLVFGVLLMAIALGVGGLFIAAAVHKMSLVTEESTIQHLEELTRAKLTVGTLQERLKAASQDDRDPERLL